MYSDVEQLINKVKRLGFAALTSEEKIALVFEIMPPIDKAIQKKKELIYQSVEMDETTYRKDN